jgi:DNA-binding PadR family transcriptional regulator
MELSNTAYVILGALQERPRSGYDIKAFTDNSTRHFWATSYGQLYPELKRLLDAGLIEAEDQPTGSRQRTLYRLTALGEKALADWVSDTEIKPCELRDEMLVRLFFSDTVPLETRIALARSMAARHRAMAGNLCKKPDALRAKAQTNPMHGEVLQFGIDLHEHMADWYERLAARLEGK